MTDVAVQTNSGILEDYIQLNNKITNENDQLAKKLEECEKVPKSRY